MSDRLKPDQPPPPNVDEVAAIRAQFKGTASAAQQHVFNTYLLKMCGVGQGEQFGQGEFWAFMSGKRWVATTLLAMAEVNLVPSHARNFTEKDNG